jgi:hypothetical protein
VGTTVVVTAAASPSVVVSTSANSVSHRADRSWASLLHDTLQRCASSLLQSQSTSAVIDQRRAIAAIAASDKHDATPQHVLLAAALVQVERTCVQCYKYHILGC